MAKKQPNLKISPFSARENMTQVINRATLLMLRTPDDLPEEVAGEVWGLVGQARKLLNKADGMIFEWRWKERERKEQKSAL